MITIVDLGLRLKEIRLALGLSQIEVAKATEIHHQAMLSRMESGKLGSFDAVFAVIQYYSKFIDTGKLLADDFKIVRHGERPKPARKASVSELRGFEEEVHRLFKTFISSYEKD